MADSNEEKKMAKKATKLIPQVFLISIGAAIGCVQLWSDHWDLRSANSYNIKLF
jgi:hypothetical protein